MPNSHLKAKPALSGLRPMLFADVPLGLICVVVTAILLAGFANSASAQGRRKSLLKAEVESIFPNVRSGAPIPMNWTLEWAGAGLLEGRLHLVLKDGNAQYGEFFSHDMVITSGQQRFSMLLPPINDLDMFTTLDIHTEFLTKDKTYDLDILARRVPGNQDRSFSVCACTPFTTTPGSWFTRLVQHLHVIAISPLEVRQQLSSLPTFVIPDEMPNDPITYCGFDLVVLSGDGFAAMGQKKLSVLHDWINAGGSVCIIPTGILSPYHATLLNELCRANDDVPPFLLDSAGKLMGTADWAAQPEVRMFRKGLGRVAIILGQPDENHDWNDAAAFLWKLRRDQTINLKAKGAWVAPQQPEIADYSDYSQIVGSGFHVQPLQSVSSLIEHLLPEGVQVVPLSLIALMLIVYVAVIGPGDYLLLGMLNQRKLTWIFFPTVTVAFTVFTVWLSHVYMASAGTRKAAVFLDVIEGGKIARRNRIELMFPASHQVFKTDVRRELFTSLNHRRFGETDYDYIPNYETRQLVETGVYTGRVPTLYTVVQEVPQWTPQMNRILSIAPEDETTKFPWDQFQRQRPNTLNRAELTKQVQQAFGAAASAYVIDSSRKVDVVTGSPVLHAPSYSWHGSQYASPGNSRQTTTFLLDVCARNPIGMFSVISQLSPNGGNNFEDLSLLDTTDPQQWMLVISVPKGDDILIYRRLYHGDG